MPETIPQERALALESALRALTSDLDDLIGNSDGVIGLHLNGDIASWEALLRGGEFSAWLSSLQTAKDILNAKN